MSAPSASGVLRAAAGDLTPFADPSVSALVDGPGERPPWLDELARLVVTGRLVVPRTTLTAAALGDFTAWARSALAGAPPAVARPLLEDMAGIVGRVRVGAGNGPVLVRVFTEAPTRRCGFHVDTVPPDSPTVGAVRVYNGPTTEYVASGDVLGMADFYAYLSRRERLSRQAADLCRPDADAATETDTSDTSAYPANAADTVDPADTGTDPATAAALGELLAMDENPSFLRPGAPIHRVPDDATVYFRHIDVTRHWSPHPVSDTWIHRSPMRGGPRLVLNVSPTRTVSANPGRR
ncbi:hypothetical protein ACFYT4_20630 [Streptomyces sp. NPDC004609]|uniref:hypothetical protein n=1 Tax=Streptomyces sp. NPDC004609 TaxID=3364704 RepID=UPI0036CD5716